MAERERRITPPYGGVFVARTRVMDADDVQRAIWRMAHEIIERNHGLDDVVLVGLQTGGVPLAERLAEALDADRGRRASPVGTLDVAFYRDDIGLRPVLPEAVTDIPSTSTGATVVLVDDVLFTGRTIRAALDALTDYGRPRAVQLAVMVDRGHRELPIRPDYVGKNLPTRRDEVVDVSDDGVDLGEMREREAPALDRRPRRATASTRCSPHRLVRRGQSSAPSRRCRRCGARPSSRSSTRTPPAPGSVRDRGQAAVGRHDDLQRRHVVGEEGRVAARHRARRSRPWASTPSSCATRRPGVPVADRRAGSTPSVINAGDGWHEHPTQALLDCYTIRQRARRRSTAAHRHRRRHQALPGRPLRRARLHRPRRRGHARGAAARCCRRASTAGRSTVSHDLDDVLPKSTSSTCCACSASA